MWLASPATATAMISLHDARGGRSYTPEQPLPLGGTLAVYSDDSIDLEAALAELCSLAHGKLVRKLANDRARERDVVAVHVARALALGTLKPAECGAVKFECFVPRPLEPRGLAALFAGTEPVSFARERRSDGELAFFDDGTDLAAMIRSILAPRRKDPRFDLSDVSERETPSVPAPAPAKPAQSAPAPAKPAREPAKPAPPKPPSTPLSRMLAALAQRIDALGNASVSYTIVDDDAPMVRAVHGSVEIAAKHPRVQRIVAEHSAGTVLAGPALDVLAAHVVSVLNIGRTDITDATELFALGVLLSQPSAGRPRSRRSS
jgi:hypothetical protein